MFTFLFLIFLLFAWSRSILRYNDRSLSLGGFIFWSLIWLGASIVVVSPGLTGFLASRLGIGRGADVVLYISIILIFYLIFRLYVKSSSTDQQITHLVRSLALKDAHSKKKRSS